MYETVLERLPRWVFGQFYGSAKYVGNFFGQRICSYVGEPENLGQGWTHKPRAQIKSSIEEGQ